MGLGLRSSNGGQSFDPNKSKKPGKSLAVNKSGPQPANKKPAKPRAALGEITNAAGNKSHWGQVKKGISVIVKSGRGVVSKSGVTSSSSSSSISSLSTVADQIEKSVQEHTQPISDSSSKSLFEESLNGDENGTTSTSSSSLPSSQEEESVKKLQAELNNKKTEQQLLDTNLSKTSNDSEVYLSASEGDEADDRSIILAPRPPVNHRYVPPSRVVPPAGVQDFDFANIADPSSCSDYAADVFQYYKDREAQFRCRDYLRSQPEISETMRAILVDWLVEVQESFELNHETLYTAVKLMDLFMSKVGVHVAKEDLQLVGATACLISCKIDERIPPNLDDFVYVCDDAYTRKDIIRKEQEMISVVDYDVGYPLSYRFLRRYGRVCQLSMPDLTLARYILELSLMDYQFNVETSESLLAAAVLVLAIKIKAIDSGSWLQPFLFYTGYTLDDVKPMVGKLLAMLHKPHMYSDHTKTIKLKYSHRVFYEVAQMAVPNEVQLTDS